ncbi:hypothetical protein HD553DRAFT_324589 [Filobasidium floriforme]|uniref:uncharacterized protein n=1 Tax=Filobasidium floriforme TaxID=5210 RepID=UPI001E8E9B1E|nr:uncharacterized protein HD553DRAFT_324589 [Filobasidium floriforme]KAH8083721.1 hypothetical protein HD553DRAFT_324589 [Filobasidium floriforme]
MHRGTTPSSRARWQYGDEGQVVSPDNLPGYEGFQTGGSIWVHRSIAQPNLRALTASLLGRSECAKKVDDATASPLIQLYGTVPGKLKFYCTLPASRQTRFLEEIEIGHAEMPSEARYPLATHKIAPFSSQVKPVLGLITYYERGTYPLPKEFRSAQLQERYTRIAALGGDHVISTVSALIFDLALTEATDLWADYIGGMVYVPSIRILQSHGGGLRWVDFEISVNPFIRPSG